jgi:ribosomal protein S18 acetylase RimI-like enzyme
MEIRSMTEEELALIDKRFPDLLHNTESVSLSAVIDDAWVGYMVAARMNNGSWHLQNIEVEPSHRRRRVASALFTEMFKRIGDAVYTLSVQSDNQVGIRLFKREGFQFTPSGGRRGPRMMIREPAASAQ